MKENLMKFLTFIFTFLLTAQAFAHTDHALGEGSAHFVYHLIFWSIVIAIVVKAIQWAKLKKANNANKTTPK